MQAHLYFPPLSTGFKSFGTVRKVNQPNQKRVGFFLNWALQSKLNRSFIRFYTQRTLLTILLCITILCIHWMSMHKNLLCRLHVQAPFLYKMRSTKNKLHINTKLSSSTPNLLSWLHSVPYNWLVSFYNCPSWLVQQSK